MFGLTGGSGAIAKDFRKRDFFITVTVTRTQTHTRNETLTHLLVCAHFKHHTQPQCMQHYVLQPHASRRVYGDTVPEPTTLSQPSTHFAPCTVTPLPVPRISLAHISYTRVPLARTWLARIPLARISLARIHTGSPCCWHAFSLVVIHIPLTRIALARIEFVS